MTVPADVAPPATTLRTSRRHESPHRARTAASTILAPLALALAVTAPDADAFRADIDAAAVGRAAVARIRGSGHQVARTSRAITSTDPELLKLTLHRSPGPATVDQGGRQSRAHGGDFVVFDMTRPYRLAVGDGCDVMAVGITRGELGPHADTVARQAARRLPADTGAQAVLSAFLLGLGRHLDELAGPAQAHVGDALVSLLLAAFTENEPGRMDTATELVDRIRVHTLANTSDPSLCVESVAAAHAISPPPVAPPLPPHRRPLRHLAARRTPRTCAPRPPRPRPRRPYHRRRGRALGHPRSPASRTRPQVPLRADRARTATPTKRDAVPGVASVKGLQAVIMERSLKVIDEELQVAGPMCRRRGALAGTRCR